MGKIQTGWYEIFEELIQRGHGTKERIVNEYTLDDIEYFLNAGDRRAKRERALFIDSVAIGAQASFKSVKKVVRDLLRQQKQIISNWENRAPTVPDDMEVGQVRQKDLSPTEFAALRHELAQMEQARRLATAETKEY